MSRARASSLEAHLDCDFLPERQPVCVGRLAEDRGSIRFEYTEDWIARDTAFQIDPALTLHKGTFHPQPDVGNFGVFLDSSPDRWGQTLMRRREALEAKQEGRKAGTLYAWDFLLGVQDATRQGALRFKEPGGDSYLDDHPLPAPPITSLRELEAVAYELSARKIDDLDKLAKWLSVLVAPGSSLGGARPKANFMMENGDLWIAKFPAQEDARDVAAWESVMHDLARASGVTVPEGKLLRFGSEHHTFISKRFDRAGGRRRHYCSAMTLLGKKDGDEGSYLEIIEALVRFGDRSTVDSHLRQLFRRVVFNVLAGHRDDHLRNHGFLLGAEGWRLAPAFDLNPNIDRPDHVLAIDEANHQPDLEIVMATHGEYRLKSGEAKTIVDEVRKAVAGWRARARRSGISAAEIELVQAAFASVGGEAPAATVPTSRRSKTARR